MNTFVLCNSLSQHHFLSITYPFNTDRFTFTVETNGSLHAKEVIKSAMVTLDDKLTRLKKAIPSLLQRDGV